MANKFSATLTAIGLGMVVLSKSLYLVDPGEKALIMNNLSGLKRKIYNQGYHLMIPFLEVTSPPHRTTSSMTPDSNPSTFTSLLVPKISRPSAFPSVSFSSQSSRSYQIFISFWERTTRRKSSTPLGRKY